MKLKIYISGPMRGIYLYNYPAFEEADSMLSEQGYEVLSPAKNDSALGIDPYKYPPNYDWSKFPDQFPSHLAIRWDVDAVLSCDEIYMLKGWELSTGGRAEHMIAVWAGKPIHYQSTIKSVALIG